MAVDVLTRTIADLRSAAGSQLGPVSARVLAQLETRDGHDAMRKILARVADNQADQLPEIICRIINVAQQANKADKDTKERIHSLLPKQSELLECVEKLSAYFGGLQLSGGNGIINGHINQIKVALADADVWLRHVPSGMVDAYNASMPATQKRDIKIAFGKLLYPQMQEWLRAPLLEEFVADMSDLVFPSPDGKQTQADTIRKNYENDMKARRKSAVTAQPGATERFPQK